MNWESSESEILLNPRLPAEEAARTLEALGKFREKFPAHFWLGTSGSSGVSKWVALSKKAILASAQCVNQHLRSDSSDRWLHVLPSCHVGGLGIWARSHLSGASVIDLGARWSKWDARIFAEVAAQEKATLSALVPTQIFDLVRAGLRASASMRAIVVGGGALADSLYRQAIELGWPLLPSYGLTECASQVATAALGTRTEDGMPKLELLRHVEVRENPQGLLEIRSDALLTAYAIETPSGFELMDPKSGGWFTTEDQGSLRGGALVVRGRSGSFVKIGGESVDFARLEKKLDEIRLEQGVELDLLLIAVPDERLGHVPKLAWACQGNHPQDSAGVTAVIERLVGRFNQSVLPIERIREARRIEVFPRSALGKPLREGIRAVFLKL